MKRSRKAIKKKRFSQTIKECNMREQTSVLSKKSVGKHPFELAIEK